LKTERFLQLYILRNKQQKQRVCCLSYCLKSHVAQFYIKCLKCSPCCGTMHPRRRRHWRD